MQKTEYLFVYNKKKGVLENESSFKNLLQTITSLSIEEDKLYFDSIEYKYDIHIYDINEKNQILFVFSLFFELDESKYDNINILSKFVRELVIKTDGRISILWDDISNYYSNKAYPLISKIENLLRKVITYFMISKFGSNWVEETIPKEIRSKEKETKYFINPLNATDFIQLSDFLFKPYANKEIDLLFKELKKSPECSNDKLFFEQFIPRSNWERYFNEFVGCENDHLQKQWKRLYELRCLVAHNNFISKTEYNEILNLVVELEKIFEEAVLVLNKIVIPEKDTQNILESVAKAKNELANQYFIAWNKIVDEVVGLYERKMGKSVPSDYKLKPIIEELVSNGYLSQEFLDVITPLGLTNRMFGNFENEFEDNFIVNQIKEIENFYEGYILFGLEFD